MRQRVLLACLVGLGLGAGPTAAQLSVEVRGGGAIGNHLPAASGLEPIPGPAFSVGLEYRVHPLASAYAAFSRAAFGCEQGFCTGREVTFTTSGPGAGIRVHAPRFPWVRLGAVRYGTGVDADGTSESVDPSVGYEAGVGVSVPLTGRLRLLPGLYLRSQAGDMRTTLLGADIGLAAALGRVRSRGISGVP